MLSKPFFWENMRQQNYSKHRQIPSNYNRHMEKWIIKWDLHTDNQIIEAVYFARLLAFHLDDKLNFTLHVSNICKSAANLLSTLIALNNFLCFEGTRIFTNSCFVTILNNFPLVWLFSNALYLNKIEYVQKWVLRLLRNDYELWYEGLLNKTSCLTMNYNSFVFYVLKFIKELIILTLVFWNKFLESNRNKQKCFVKNIG